MLASRTIQNISRFYATEPFACRSEIVAISRWAPPKIVTSKEIEEQLLQCKIPVRFDIEKMTGVRERRVADKSMSVVDMAMKACEELFRRTKVLPSMIDLVIFTSVCREYLEPATAVVISKRLGINRAKAFDLSNACLGFVDGWMTADAMIQAGRSRLCLVVGAEISSHFWEMALESLRNGHEDPASLLPAFTLGDGSAAMLLRNRVDRKNSFATRAGIRESYGEFSELCVIRDHTTPMVTNAGELLGAALKHTPKLVKDLLEFMDWQPLQVDLVVPHQASLKVIAGGCHLTRIPMSKAHVTLDRFGNLASVSVPFTLSEALEKGVKPNQKIIIAGYGSGLGVGILALTVNKC